MKSWEGVAAGDASITPSLWNLEGEESITPASNRAIVRQWNEKPDEPSLQLPSLESRVDVCPQILSALGEFF
jgi:hypothetical protein